MTPASANTGKGKYRLIAELGRGGMSHVFLAVVQGPGGFNKFQVVKRLRSDLAEDQEFLTMFMEEARLSARINHPNVVQTNEIGHDGQYYFIAMEYLDGQSFEAILRRGLQKGGVPVPIQLRIIAEALAGLQYAHDLHDYEGNPLHVVHRDISPHNLFVTYEGHVKVVDFGIAKAADGVLQTRTGVFKGKCAYMAPEQFLGEKVDRRADLFSVGAMLWHTATGKRLWRGLTDIQIYTRLSQGSIPEVRDFNPNVDPRLETIVMRALAPDPSHRYANATELQTALENYLEALEVRVTAREVGRYTADLFADSRAEIRKAIEKQLRASSGPATAEVPALASLVPTGTVDVSPPPRRWSEGEQNIADRSGDSLQPPPTFAMPPSNTANEATPAPFTPNESLPRHETTQPLATTTSASPRPSRNSRGLLIALVAAPILLLTVVGVALMSRKGEPSEGGPTSAATKSEPKPESPTKTAPTPTEPTTKTTAQKAKLTVNVTPVSARIYLDGDPIAGNPATTSVSIDNANHSVRAEAPGYVTKSESIAFDRSTLDVTLKLDRAAPGKPGKTPPTTATATPTATTTTTASIAPPPDPMALPPVSKPKPPLDESDPWKK